MATNIDDVYAKALEMSVNVDNNFFELARSLRQLLDRDPDKFKKVIDKSDLGMRKGYYLVNIAKWFDGLRVSRTRLKKIGWTKLQVIGPKVTPKNVEELLTLAETHSTVLLKKLVKGDTASGDHAHCVLMYFSHEDYELFEEVLARHGAIPHRKGARGMNEKEPALIRALKRVPRSPPKPAPTEKPAQ